MPVLLEVKNLHKKFGDNAVLRDVSLTLSEGEIIGVIGSSGAGKSTLLRCIGGLEKASEGTVCFNGNAANGNGGVGFVFQELHLWPHKTVLENVTEALTQVKKMRESEAEQIASGLLAKFDLAGKRNDYPENLSGGEKQRVALARAIATNPKILLLDEITSSLDPELVFELLGYIKSLAEGKDGGKGMSIIVVSHNLEFVKRLAHRVLFMENGLVIEEGSPEKIFSSPQNARTRAFVEKIQLKA